MAENGFHVDRFKAIEYYNHFQAEGNGVGQTPLTYSTWRQEAPRKLFRQSVGPNQEAIFAAPNEEDLAALEEAIRTIKEQERDVLFGPMTTSAVFLYPDLQFVEAGTSLESAATDFLAMEQYHHYHVAMCCLADVDMALRYSQWSRWGENLAHVRLLQVVSGEDIPVFGGQVAMTYSGNQLLMIDSLLYPVRDKELVAQCVEKNVWNPDRLNWYQQGWLNNLPDFLQPTRFVSPPIQWSPVIEPTTGASVDRCVFPFMRWFEPTNSASRPQTDEELMAFTWYLNGSDAGWGDEYLVENYRGGIYRPAWRVILEDAEGHHWLTIVDAETEQVLWLYSTELSAPHPVFLTARDALPPANPTVQNLRPYTGDGERKVTFLLDGINIGQNRFVNPDLGNTSPNAQVTANVYYHLLHIQETYKNKLQAYGLGVTSPTRPNDFDQINVLLPTNPAEMTSYRWSDHRIKVGPDNPGAVPPIFEPGFDAEVLYHEYSHAVVSLLLDEKHIQYNPLSTYIYVLQEAWAFYFGCALTLDELLADNPASTEVADKANWADFAYRGQPISLADQLVGYDQLANQDNHKKGAWWTRLFWWLLLNHKLPTDRLNHLALALVQAAAYTGDEETARHTFAAKLVALLSEVDSALSTQMRTLLIGTLAFSGNSTAWEEI